VIQPVIFRFCVLSTLQSTPSRRGYRLVSILCRFRRANNNMSTTSATLTFPHAVLTPVIGKPTSTSIKLLTKELFTNARAIPSTRGGGNHGHLGIAMSAADYLVVTTGTAFDLPEHPGPAPIHLQGATAAAIAETTRVYTTTLKELDTANNVKQALKKQIIDAVDHLYLADLEDDTFGFADVTVPQMMAHLANTYGTLTRLELERNRASIATAWNLDDPIETLWSNLKEIKRISIAGNDELTDRTIVELTMTMFEKTGVFTYACDTWNRRELATQTLANFVVHFNTENKDRLRKLTALQAGYHSAHLATPETPPPATIVPPSPAVANVARQAPVVITNDNVRMYYCWSHGLGTNPIHTSARCTHPNEGHIRESTVTNMQGGNNTIMTGRRARRRIPTHPEPAA
jgi:hypothetical protein